MQGKRRKFVYVFAFCTMFLFLLSMAGCQKEEESLESISEESLQDSDDKQEKEEEQEETIVVYVCGCVKNPGVYELPSDARVSDAVQFASGFQENAAEEAVNLAKKVEDGEQIYIPSKEEASQKAYSGKGGQEDDDSVNLNTADLEELKTLPGIGDAKAKSIINYREEHGGFENIEEIMQIEGIKDGVFQKIKDKIKV